MGKFINTNEEVHYNARMRFVHMCDYLASRKVIDYIESL